MTLVILRGLLAHKTRLLTTALAVTLGVAMVSGTLVLSDTISQTLGRTLADQNAGIDAVVRQTAVLRTSFGDQRTRLPQAVLATVTATDGVAAAEGTIEGYAQVVDPSGDPIGEGRDSIGRNWPEIDERNPWVLVEGRPPETPDEVVVDQWTADAAGVGVGDPVRLLLATEGRDMTVAGVARFGDRDSPVETSVVLFETRTAQELVGQRRELDAIVVTADPGVGPDELVERLTTTLPDGVEAVTADQYNEDQRNEQQAGLVLVEQVLVVFSTIALLTASLLIHNTFTITVTQRTRELALLRCLGGSRRQVLGSVLIEAAIVGVLAAGVGIVAGIAIAGLLQQVVTTIGFVAPAAGTVLHPRTVLAGLAAGVGVTLVASTVPAWRAARVLPVAALREVAAEKPRVPWRRTVVGIVALIVSGFFLAAGLGVGRPVGETSVVLVGIAGVGVLLGQALVGPALARPASTVVGRAPTGWAIVTAGAIAATAGLFILLGSLVDGFAVGIPLAVLIAGAAALLVPTGFAAFGVGAKLGRENVVRNPRRTASTAAALSLGVAVVAVFLVIADSVRTSVDSAVDDSFRGDYVIDSSRSGLNPDVAASLDALEEVDVAVGIRRNLARIGEGSPAAEAIPAADVTKLARVIDFGVVEGSVENLGPESIAVQVDRARAEGWVVGERVPVEFATTGTHLYEVGMLFEDSGLANTQVLFPIEAFEANFADQLDYFVFVALTEFADPWLARAHVQEIVNEFPAARVLDVEQFKASSTAQIDEVVGLVFAVLFLAVIVALLGITNTLALSVLERTRELGLLRALGMTPDQLRDTVRWESVIIALTGTLLGVATGTLFGWAIVRSLEDTGVRNASVPVTQLILAMVVGALVGVAASVLPARRASKLDVLEALATT
ncbi:MAG: FtsX-like permease family protein [Actinomycetota bacterium]|nr:FtsX-like permease family protein [Actinomycetota bacterium]